METLAIPPSPMVIKSIVEQHIHIYAIPMHVTLFDLGYKDQNQLMQLGRKFTVVFNKNIDVSYADTVHSISEKLLTIK